MTIRRLSILMVLLLASIWLASGWYFYSMLQKDQENYSQKQLADLSLTWTAVERWQKKGRDLAFQSFVQTDDVLELLVDAQDPNLRDAARSILLEKFRDFYLHLSQQGVYQFQFVLPDNTSLLRLHKPEKYGDNLSDVRESFRRANETLKPNSSFEFGRLQPGFRSVYPIIGFEQHLGAVELSSSLEILRRDLTYIDSSKEYVFVLKNDVLDVLFEENRTLLMPSSFNQSWLQEDPMFDSHFPAEPLSDLAEGLAHKISLRSDVAEKMDAGRNFALVEKYLDTSYVISFLSIPDVTQNNQAFLIAINAAPMLDGLQRDFYEKMLVISLLLFALGWLLYALIKHREELRIAATAFNVQEGITVTDTKGKILKVNDAFTKLTGYKASEVLGKNPSILSSGMQDEQFYKTMWQHIKEHGSWQGEIWNRRKNGELYVEWLAITAVYNHRNEVTHYVGAFLDITQRKEDEEQIRRLAFYDSLTDLPNRRLLNDRIEHALATSSRTYRNGAILFIDMDNFKTLNDTKGHDVGDLMLQEVAKRLKSCVRESDTVARLGGDEFVVLIENLNSNQQKAYIEAEYVAEEIRTSLNQPYHFSDYIHFSSPSIGVALFSGYPSTTLDELMKNADSAMYKAKNAGRNQIQVFDPAMQSLFEKRKRLETDLAKALDNQELKLYLQPLIDLENNKVVSAEALIRWDHPEKGLLLPEEFMDIATETGLLTNITNWLLAQACELLASWGAQPDLADLKISINIYSRQLLIEEFRDQIKQCISTHRIPKHKLVLELSELDLPKNIDDLQDYMRDLITHDVLFVMDNYGSGKLSILNLMQLPIEQLKLDCKVLSKTFVLQQTALPEVLQAIGSALGLQTSVIGVEDKSQSELLFEQGYKIQQGNFFSKPLTEADFIKLVKKYSA